MSQLANWCLDKCQEPSVEEGGSGILEKIWKGIRKTAKVIGRLALGIGLILSMVSIAILAGTIIILCYPTAIVWEVIKLPLNLLVAANAKLEACQQEETETC